MRIPHWFLAAFLVSAEAFAFPQSTHPAMLDPAKATVQAPETFKAKFETTKGDVVFECTRAWAPHGVDRFYNLVRIGFFDDVALFRVSKTFVVQWGIHGDPKVAKVWQDANLEPDPPKQSNTRGMLTYAMAGGSAATRSTQLFINYADNSSLDAQGFAPICKVSEGMDIADKFYSDYGERVTGMQGQIAAKGNAYLKEAWPKLDYIKKATVVGEALDPQRGSKADDQTATTNEEAAAKDESSPVPWIIGIAIAIGVGAWMFRTKKAEPPPPPPKAEGKKKKKKKK